MSKFNFGGLIRRVLGLDKVKIIMDKGTDVPGPPVISRTGKVHITDQKNIEDILKEKAERLEMSHPNTGPGVVSYSVSRSGFGRWTLDFYLENIILQPGSISFFWGFPDVQDREFLNSRYLSQGDDSAYREKNIEGFRSLVIDYLMATYINEDAAVAAEKSGIPIARARTFLEELGNSRKKTLVDKIDWKKEAKNCAVIKTSYKIVGKDNKQETSVQVIEDQEEGIDLFESPVVVSDILKENNIKATNDDNANTAAAIQALSKKYADAGKTVIVLCRDENLYGNKAIDIASKIGLKAYPIIDRKGIKRVQRLRDEGILYEKNTLMRKITRSAAALTAAGLIGFAAGMYANGMQSTPEKQRAYKSSESKPAKISKPAKRKRTSEKNPTTAEITPFYNTRKNTVSIGIEAEDKDGIDSIVVSAEGKKYKMKNVFIDKNYCTGTSRKKKCKKEVSETYEADAGLGKWIAGDTYVITMRVKDAKGNISTYQSSLKVPY